MTAFELAGKLKLDSSEFSSSLDKQESSFKRFGDRLGGLAKKVGKVALAGLATVGAGSVMFIKSSIQEGLNFDAAMSQVAATMGKTTEEIQELSKFARKMGAETAFSATEAAQALNYMALAGYDAETSMKMLPIVLNLAAAGNMDLARASDMVTDTQSALGLSLEDTTRLVDQMAKTSSKTNTSVEQLGDAMLTVGGTAKIMGSGTIDTTTELSMALGVLADNGIKGAEGGTALRNVLLSLTAPTDKAAEALNALGIDVFDAEGNMRDLPDIMADINEATKDMNQAERTEFLSTVFNKRDLKAVEALLATDMSRWQELYGEIGDASGAAEKMAATQLDNLAGDIKIFQSALSEARISLSDKLAPTLRKVVQKATTYVNRLTQAFNEKGLSGAIGEAKVILRETVAELLGLGTDARWSDIGKKVIEKIRNGIKNRLKRGKVKLASLFGLDDSASWRDIIVGFKDKLKSGFGKLKVKLTNVFDLNTDANWADIGRKIIEKLTTYFSRSGDFLKKLILGNEFTSESTWTDVGRKISEWINEALSEGGFLDTILGNSAERIAAMAEFAGDLISSIADWIGTHVDTVVDIITTIANALARAAGPVISALLKILADPRFWRGLVSALGSLLKAALRLILGKQAADFLFGVDEEELKAQNDAKVQEDIDRRDAESERLQNKLDEYKSEGAPLNQEQKELLKEYFNALMTGGDIGSILDKTFDIFPDNDIINYWLQNIDLFYEKVKDTESELETLPDDFFDINKQAELLTNQTADLKKNIESIVKFVEKWAIGYPKFIYSNYLEDFVGTPNHNAKGLWDVPYDDYYTRLHRGEMVLSASRARDYRDGSGGKAIDFTDMEDRIISAIQYGMGKANVNAFVTDRQAGMGANRYTGYKMDAGRFRP